MTELKINDYIEICEELINRINRVTFYLNIEDEIIPTTFKTIKEAHEEYTRLYIKARKNNVYIKDYWDAIIEEELKNDETIPRMRPIVNMNKERATGPGSVFKVIETGPIDEFVTDFIKKAQEREKELKLKKEGESK